jgi:hypothetical protein
VFDIAESFLIARATRAEARASRVRGPHADKQVGRRKIVISGSPSWQRVFAHFTRDMNWPISDPVITLRNRRAGGGNARVLPASSVGHRRVRFVAI